MIAHHFVFNLGGLYRKKTTLLNLDVGSALQLGWGYSYVFSDNMKWSVFIENFGETPLIDVQDADVSTPVEVLAGIKKNFGKNNKSQMTLGLGKGISYGYGAPDYRIFGGVTWQYGDAIKPVVNSPAPRPIKVKKKVIEKNQVISFGEILFVSGSDSFLKEAYPVLDEAKKLIRENPEIKLIEIQGHTDHNGSEKFNLDLSTRRARKVFQYFKVSGIKESRLTYKGYGESQPIDSNETKQGRRKNRRVVFKILELSEN